MAKRQLVLLLIVAAFLGTSGCLELKRYRLVEFRGAGPVTDSGFLSYPRYHAPIGEFPLAGAGAYTFKFSGLPSEALSLQLYIEPFSESDRQLFESLTTKIVARIEDTNGIALCEGSGTPAARRTGVIAMNEHPKSL